MKEKIKTTSFWLEMSGVILVVIDTISTLFNLNLYSQVVQSIFMSMGSILVVVGVITKKNSNDKDEVSKEELLEDFEMKDDIK